MRNRQRGEVSAELSLRSAEMMPNRYSDRLGLSSGLASHAFPLVFLLAFLAANLGCSSLGNMEQDLDRASADLLIEDVTVIDAAGGLRAHRSVYLKAGKISAILSASEPGPAVRKVIDGRGRYLIPGLWDMHVHVTYLPELTEAMPSLFLDYGITSVRDTGALLHKMRPVLEDWRDSENQAPRIYWSGPLLDGSRVVYDGKDRPEIGIANPTREAARARVDSLAHAGVDFIKIYELVDPDVFSALVESAQRHSLPIAAHVPLSMTADEAGPRVDSMEHLRNVELACSAEADALKARRLQLLSDEARGGDAGVGEAEVVGRAGGHALRSQIHREQRTRALGTLDVRSARCQRVIASLRNTIQVPTLRLNTISQFSPIERADWEPALAGIPATLAAEWRTTAGERLAAPDPLNLSMAQWSLDLVSAMQEAGVPIGAGTDTPIAQAIPGYSLHTELERLVAAGLSPSEALRAATQRPAEFLGRETQTGQIAVGMDADLVLLGANPLEAIANTREVELVILRGEIVRGGR